MQVIRSEQVPMRRLSRFSHTFAREGAELRGVGNPGSLMEYVEAVPPPFERLFGGTLTT